AGGSEQLNFPRNLFTYPLMFLLPNGKVLYAGNADGSQTQTRLLDLTTGWSTSALTSPDAGATAVMYRPGRIMKCGGADPVAPTDTISFDSNGLPGAWASTNNPMPDAGRMRMNLTVLPNGQVLATGGKSTNGTARLNPRLWNPQTATWSSTPILEPEPVPRGYHSTAALLPDGRILSA